MLTLGGAAASVVVVVWAGATLALAAAAQPVDLSVGQAADALPRLPGHLGDPAGAWPGPVAQRLPGAGLYWACTTVTAAVAAVVGVLVLRLVTSRPVGTVRRRPLGVNARPGWARRRDLAPVLTRTATPGRFVVARFGRWLVATEVRTQRRSRRRRRGDRGAVALVGPSRSGKTTAAVSGILEWEGPAILSSVKADLLGATLGWRARGGQVRVYDPTRTLGPLAGPSAKVGPARWSPVGQAASVVGAQRAARALVEAAPRGGVEGGVDFWLAQAEILLSGLLFVAHHTHRDMSSVADWVLLQDRPSDLGPGEVRTCLDLVLAGGDARVATGAAEAARGLLAIWEMEDRTRSSVYATAQTVVWPWAEPTVATSSHGPSVDLDWLLGDANTVYLCAPIEDQRRLAPAFGGLLNDLIAQAYRRVAATGRPLDPPLLVVIDEAGNTPLRALPEYASTLAGIGVLLVTIWQSLAQIEASYGREADTILTNHLTKVFYAGLSDPASLRYVAQVLGDAEVETRSQSLPEALGRASTQLSTTRTALAPAHALRQMQPGDGLLVHGTLPPAHVRAHPYYSDR
ncbi:MAG TPA: type IV secretory system conjugative DNA transfer family protein, partial [Acidimicrobiales bacterium]|nr:type IV secretory system conjugative DNA transfer family protein [Acidimicrobiales bacterium]